MKVLLVHTLDGTDVFFFDAEEAVLWKLYPRILFY